MLKIPSMTNLHRGSGENRSSFRAGGWEVVSVPWRALGEANLGKDLLKERKALAGDQLMHLANSTPSQNDSLLNSDKLLSESILELEVSPPLPYIFCSCSSWQNFIVVKSLKVLSEDLDLNPSSTTN